MSTEKKRINRETRKSLRKANKDINSAAGISFGLIGLSVILLVTHQIETDAFFQLLVGILTLMATMAALILTRRGIDDAKNANILSLNATLVQSRIESMKTLNTHFGHYISFKEYSSILTLSEDEPTLSIEERLTIRNLLPKTFEKLVSLEKLRNEMKPKHIEFKEMVDLNVIKYKNPKIFEFFRGTNYIHGINEVDLEKLKEDSILWAPEGKPSQALTQAYQVIKQGKELLSKKEDLQKFVQEEVTQYFPKALDEKVSLKDKK